MFFFTPPSGLKRQVGGVSFKSLSSALSLPPSPHPWHQRNQPWLGTGLVEAALIQAESCQDIVKSIKLLSDIGNIGVTGVYAEQRFSSGLGSFIEKLVEDLDKLDNSPLHSEALTALTSLWNQSKVGSLNLPPSVLALVLDQCEDLFTQELDQAIFDSSWLAEGQDYPSPLVLKPISQSQSLFVKFMKMFASKLKWSENQPLTMKTFQHFSEVILSLRTNPITLYPANQQGLVAGLLLYRDLVKIGGTDNSNRIQELKKKIVCYDLSDVDTWLICAQFNVLNLFD